MPEKDPQQLAACKAEKLIIEAEAAKAQLFPLSGNEQEHFNYQFTAKIDEDYLVVMGHIDDSMQTKIVRGEYVDFGKLLPRDQILAEEDG